MEQLQNGRHQQQDLAVAQFAEKAAKAAPRKAHIVRQEPSEPVMRCHQW
jgi:hypothetical protein